MSAGEQGAKPGGGADRRSRRSALLGSPLIRSAGVYTVARVANTGIPFLMMPVLTRYLDPQDYGLVAMFGVLVSLVTPFVGLSLHGGISVRYFDREKRDLAAYIGSSHLILALAALAAAVALGVFAGPVARLAAFPRGWLWAVVAVAACQTAILMAMTLWQSEGRAARFGVFLNLQTLANVGLSLLFVVGMGRRWEGRIAAQVLTAVGFAAAGAWLLGRGGRLRIEPRREHFSYALAFGVPLIPHALGGVLMGQTDRVMLANLASVADAGVYTVAFQLAWVIELLASSFNQAYSPWLFRQLSGGDPSAKPRIVRLTYAYFAAILALAALFAFGAPWFLGFFVGAGFRGAGRYTPWLGLAFACSGMYYMVTNYIFFARRTAALGLVTAATALLNVGFCYLLVRANGAVGAAQATALAYFLSFALTWIVSARVYPMPWGLSRRRRDGAPETR